MNNLKQLGLAAHSFESAQRKFPGGGVVDFGDPLDPKFDPQSGPMLSWIVLLLPYFEQQNLYDLFDLSASVLEQANEPQEAQPDSLLCPSDPSANLFYSDPVNTNQKRFAKGNYAAFVSPYHIRNQIRFPGAISGTGQRISDISDGTSNTLMLTEVRTPPPTSKTIAVPGHFPGMARPCWRSTCTIKVVAAADIKEILAVWELPNHLIREPLNSIHRAVGWGQYGHFIWLS